MRLTMQQRFRVNVALTVPRTVLKWFASVQEVFLSGCLFYPLAVVVVLALLVISARQVLPLTDSHVNSLLWITWFPCFGDVRIQSDTFEFSSVLTKRATRFWWQWWLRLLEFRYPLYMRLYTNVGPFGYFFPVFCLFCLSLGPFGPLQDREGQLDPSQGQNNVGEPPEKTSFVWT